MSSAAVIGVLLVGIVIGTRLRRWRFSSYDPVIHRTIKSPVTKPGFEKADEALYARAAERRQAADQMRRDASAVRSGDDSERFRRKVMSAHHRD